eukprot:3368773-Prymnesium_polylepis.1
MSVLRERRRSPLVPAPAAAPRARRRADALPLDEVAHDASAAVTTDAGRPGSSTDMCADAALSCKRKRTDGAWLPCNRA